MRNVLLFALAFSAASLGAASADTIYDFDTLVSTGAHGAIPPIGFQLTLSDNFVPESFSRQCGYGGCGGFGDFSSFSLAFTFNGARFGTLNDQPDPTFESTNGSLDGSSGSIFWATTMNTVTLTFGLGVWSAIVDSDGFPDLCAGAGCTASGTLSQEVPEPWTLGLFAVGLAAVAATRRRRPPSVAGVVA